MTKAWIVVADSSRARIFLSDPQLSGMKELEVLVHPEGHLHEQELTSDLPGKTKDRHGSGRHALEERTSPKVHELEVFAKYIADHLNERTKQQAFERLVLIAPSSLLGILRKKLDSQTAKLVVCELDKNLAKQDVKAIRKHLPEKLPYVISE
jgi:protein required for attachment to host cells